MPNAVACSPTAKGAQYTRYHPFCLDQAGTGLVYVVPSSMKQISRQRLWPDLQDMECSSGGVEEDVL
jgi:hypothetical protein